MIMANTDQLFSVSQKPFQVLHTQELISPDKITDSEGGTTVIIPISQRTMLRHEEASELAPCLTTAE